MRAVLEVVSGPSAGIKAEVLAGQVLRVGSRGPSEFLLPDDLWLSSVHFALECELGRCRVRNLTNRAWTAVNGGTVTEATLRDGDTILAGETTFAVRLDGSVAAPAPAVVAPVASPEPPAPPPTPRERVLQVLRGQAEPLFALLDAARTPRVLELLRGSGEEHQSLYEGAKGEELAEWAPYVVRLPAQSGLLETLVREGWGESWGVYFTSEKTLAEVRKHFRHFLMVRLADGRTAYFRFYDPRVLRVYLPSCNATEAAQFFGPVRGYLMEAKEANTLLQFGNSGRGAGLEAVPLTVPTLKGGST